MYKLTYKGQLVDGFDTEQVVGNLAQLLNLKPKAVRLAFLSDRPSVIKLLDSASEVERWCAAFQEAGVYLDVANVDASQVNNIADQIELDLELHELDLEDEEPEERHYLIRKVIEPEPDPEPEIFSNLPIATRPIRDYAAAVVEKPATPAVKGMAQASTAPAAAAPAKKSINGTEAPKGINGSAQSVAKTDETGIPATAASQTKTPEIKAPQTKINGTNHSKGENGHPVAAQEFTSKSSPSKPSPAGQAASKQPSTQAPSQPESIVAAADPIEVPRQTKTAKSVASLGSAAALAPAASVGELSVAQIDALAAKALLEDEFADDESTAEEILEPAPENGVHDDTGHFRESLDARRISETEEDEYPDERYGRGYARDEDPEYDRRYEERYDDEDDRYEDERYRDERYQEEEEELLEDVNFHKSHFVWGMLVILLAIITTAGTILWLKRSTWTPVAVAPVETRVLDAMASSALFGLAHADLARLQMLSPTTDIFSRLPEPSPGFWSGLAASGIDLKQQTADIWLGGYGQQGESKALWVLHGNFPVASWREWFTTNYIIDSDNPDGLLFSTLDESSCEKSKIMSAAISKDQIVLGAPELVAAYTGRLQAGAPAEKNLGTWAKGYNTQMISAVLFQPGQLPEGTAAMALGKLSLPAEPIQGIYLGLEPKKFPPSLEFSAFIESNNPQFIADAAGKLTAATAAAKTTIATDWPETLPIYERLKIAQDGNRVRAILHMDDKAPEQLQLWIASLLNKAFAPEAPPASELAEERLEENPPQFVNLDSADLPTFNTLSHLNETFIAQTSTGPFGIGVRTVEQTDAGVEINLDVNALNLPNLGKEAEGAALLITDVVDHQDQSLLANLGTCDVQQPARINSVYQGNGVNNGELVSFTGLQGAKKILLPAGMALSSVGAVKGVISHQLPVEVERLNLNGPLAGKTLDAHGVQLRFLSAGPSRLHFQVTGNTAALLQVNALNADGKVLAANNAVRGDAAFSSGKTVSIDYQGEIAGAEIVIASKIQPKNYPFSIARLFPPAKPFAGEKSAPVRLSTASLPALEKDSPPSDVIYPFQTPRQTLAAGPALIAVNELAISAQSFSLAADIYTRNSHPLVGQLSAVSLAVTEIEDSTGNLRSVNHQAPAAMDYMGGSWVDGKFEPDPNRPWLRGSVDMRNLPLEQNDVVALWGKLVFLATADPIAVTVPFQFGMQWHNSDGVLTLRRWEAGRLIFDVEGSFPGLMTVKALDETGAVVSQPAELRTGFGKSTIELEVKQIPDSIEFSIARTQKPKEFPVEIRVIP